MANNSIKPFELLIEYEKLSLKHKVMTAKPAVQHHWSGVGFKVGDVHYAMAIDTIIEVLILVDTTKIPGIAPWVLGLGNIRGNLIPVIDLKSYLDNRMTKTTAHTRMMVIQQIGGLVGLVVDEVFGQKHFTKQSMVKKADKNKKLSYTEVSYKENEVEWNVLDAELLINDPAFQNAAAK